MWYLGKISNVLEFRVAVYYMSYKTSYSSTPDPLEQVLVPLRSQCGLLLRMTAGKGRL
jgi:hypothetical protein